nr:MAG TPA: protein of unknown function (DUF3330) [Caudoviricetes sp.]
MVCIGILFSVLNPKDGDELVCPVCGKKFKFGERSKYIVAGGYVCSWECFLKRGKHKEEN